MRTLLMPALCGLLLGWMLHAARLASPEGLQLR